MTEQPRPTGDRPAHPGDAAHPAKPAILVVGYGNPLREDDGAGWYVAGRIAERYGDAAQVLRLHQLAPELSAEVAGVDLVIFVDARADKLDLGLQVTRVEPVDAPARSHYCSPGAILAAAQTLFGRCPPGYLVSIPAHSFAYAERLTPQTLTAAGEAVEGISRLIDDALAGRR